MDASDARPLRDGVVRLGDGRRIGYAEYGDLDGDAVFWFHGTPGGRQQIPPAANAEARARRMRIIGLDRPGTGRSTTHVYRNVAAWAWDVMEVADRLGAERFAAVGLSGGGPYVLACAHELPDRVTAGVVLGGIGPTTGPEAAPGYTRAIVPFAPLLAAVRAPLGLGLTYGARGLSRWASAVYDLYAFYGPWPDRKALQHPEFKEMFTRDLLACMDGGLAAPALDAVLFARPWGFQLSEIRVPIVFFQGDVDIVVPPSHGIHQAALVPGSKLVPVHGEGHFAGFLEVGRVLDEIRERWPDERAAKRPAKGRPSGAPASRPKRRRARKPDAAEAARPKRAAKRNRKPPAK